MEAQTQERTAGPDVHKLLEAVDALPTMPLVAERVGRMVHDPRSDARAIANVMRGDPALTAKVLKLVNSPYFGIPGGVTDVQRAISFLGFNTLYQLVLTASVFGVLSVSAEKAAKRLLRHSLGTAGAAEAIAELTGYPLPAECFTAGLLHDLGKLALLQVDPDLFMDVVELATREQMGMHEAELRIGLPPHPSIGLRLVKRWRFPLALQLAIGHHHDESLGARPRVPKNLHPVIDAVLLGNIICNRMDMGAIDGHIPELPHEALARLELTPDVETVAYEELRWKMERSEALAELLLG